MASLSARASSSTVQITSILSGIVAVVVVVVVGLVTIWALRVHFCLNKHLTWVNVTVSQTQIPALDVTLATLTNSPTIDLNMQINK